MRYLLIVVALFMLAGCAAKQDPGTASPSDQPVQNQQGAVQGSSRIQVNP